MNIAVQKKLNTFFKQFKTKIFKKGEFLLRADENPAHVFFLTKGEVKQYIISRKGEEVVLNIFKPISYFPVSIALIDKPNVYFYEAISECEVAIAPKKEVAAFLKIHADILFDLLTRMFSGIDGLLTRMIYLMSGSAYPRLIAELITLAKRFGDKDEKTGMVRIKLIEKDIAAQTGMTRETVSREMKMLKQKSLIEFHKNILIIKNLEKLQSELDNY